MKTRLTIFSVIMFLAGCATQRSVVVVNSASDMVILIEPAKAHVGTWQGGRWQDAGTMMLPAGWVCGPERK